MSGGDSSDLQALISDTQNAVSGTNQLNADASTFNQDATSYLNANSPYLAPGWEQGYSTVTNDINALASDCNLRRHQRTHQATVKRSGARQILREALNNVTL